MGDKAPDCEDTDPNACRVWCYRNIPEQSVTITTRGLSRAATAITEPCNGGNGTGDCTQTATYTKRVLAQPATTREVTIPAVTKTITKTVMVSPATTRQIPIPAITKTIKTTVMVKPATTREVTIPAVTKAVRKTVMTPATTRSITVPAVTKTITKRVMVKPATTRQITIPAVTKSFKTTVMVKPATTREVTIPAVTKAVRKTVITPATTREVTIPAVTKTVRTTVMVKPATTTSIAIPAQFKTVTKTVLAKAAWTEETTVPAQNQTVTKEILVTKGGITAWREIDCKLQQNTMLPINWNTGSATLTSSAKSIIDSKLMPILNNGISIALASHTDSQGSSASNQRLSERRAQAVVNYLIAKGVNPSQLTGKGYGENRLTNRCADGVTCTAAEHRANRRTTFRVVSK